MQTVDLQVARLSRQQERMWQWLQDNRAGCVQAMLMLQGPLDLDHFRQALQHVVERCEIFRTTFSTLPGMEFPMQMVNQRVEISCPLVNLGILDLSSQRQILTYHWQKLTRRPFDLEGGSLLDTFLFRFTEQRHVLMLRICALCADQHTLKFLIAEVTQTYAKLQQSETHVNIEEEVLQYINVISWQQKLLTSDDAAAQQEIWRSFDLADLLASRLPLVNEERLYTARGREALAAFPLRQLPIVLETTEQRRLADLSHHYQISLEAPLLACWLVLLWRLTGTAPLVGVVYDGRGYEELATALGLYAQTVPFSLHLDETMSFEQVLTETSLTMQEIDEKQLYFSWETFAADLQPQEQVFPIAFSFESWPASWEGGSLGITLLEQHSWREPCLLHLYALQVGMQVQLQLVYQSTVFSQQQAQRLADLLLNLLHSAVTIPDASIGRLALLSKEQQSHQQEYWRGPERAWQFQPLHRLFEAQVCRQPEAPAVRSGSQTLSYIQLEQRANQLAHLLLRQGLRPGSRVVLSLPRDCWAIVSLLAVLKAGGTYVPLEMEQPKERLQALLQCVEPALILGTQALEPHLSQTVAPLLPIEDISPLLVEYPDTPPHVEIGPHDLAYIIFTSGSTGVPKGVMIQQQSVSNYTRALCEILEVPAGWHFATVSSLATDLGNTAIFCGLASGGCVHVLSFEQVTDAAALQAYGQQFPLDVLKIAPSHLQALLTAGADAIIPLQRLILGGEALPWSLVEQVQQRHPCCRLYNHYGPTEATIGALVYPLGEAQQIQLPPIEQRGLSVPIGLPVANTQVYVLGHQQQLVPEGVIAELYIGGVGIAAGYLNQEEQTRQRFVEMERDGERHRLYRTGDWVRAREKGVLEFVGRQDTQVKLRGYRIELGEIEEQLRQHSAVRQAVVQLRAEEGREAQLIGYIVPWQQPGPDKQEIRQALEERLPAYMVPTAFVLLERLPLTANGKVDHQRLPAPTEHEEQQERSGSLVGARTSIEALMIDIWQEVLHRTSIGITDNFFRLGGHSLLGMQLIARLRAVFRVEVSINWLFEAPTVAQLAKRVEALLRGQEYASLPPIQSVSRNQDLPLSFAQRRLWFLHQLEPEDMAYIIPITVAFEGGLDLSAFEGSLARLITRHEVLRTTFQDREGRPYQVINRPGRSNILFIDLQALSPSQRESIARKLREQEVRLPFDLHKGPLLRCWLLRLAEQKHWVHLSLHHIVSDGWSRGILVQELTSLYQRLRAGETATLAPLPIQYADYAYWQREWLQGEVLKEQIRYWTHQLNGAHALELPTDYPRSGKLSHRGARYTFQVDANLTQALGQLSRQEGVTLFMTLLCAFQVLLSRISGEYDVVVGTDSANRGHLETEGLIGFFINLLALRTNLYKNPQFLSVLHAVRETVLGAYAHQELPFEMIAEHLHLMRKGNRTPLVNVLFVMQNVPHTEAEFPDLVVRPVESEAAHAKFDLALFISEGARGLSGSVIYSTDLFEGATIAKMMSSYGVLLQDIVIHPEAPVNNLEVQFIAEKEEGERSKQSRILAHKSKLKKIDRAGTELN